MSVSIENGDTLIKAVTFTLAVAAFALLTPMGAQAQAIDPQCKNMSDKRGCTCALKYGGKLSPDGKRWTYPARSINEFAACRGGKS